MSRKVVRQEYNPNIERLATGALKKVRDETGKFPIASVIITPLNGTPSVRLDRFLSYTFSSSIMIPVDTFQFTFAAPDQIPFRQRVNEGDIVSLFYNDIMLSTGLIDQIDIQVDGQFGEQITITGRDLMGQLEDQDAVSLKEGMLYGGPFSVKAGVEKLIQNTKIQGVELTHGVPKSAQLLSTEAGETKLAALQRFLEPLNCVAWMAPNGKIRIGKPNMRADKSGDIFLMKEERRSNVLHLKASFASNQIPNIFLPIWSGQETVQNRITPSQFVENHAPGPERLRKLGKILPKAIITSTPTGGTAQDLSEINLLRITGGNTLRALAARECARANQKELIVQAVVPGHYNSKSEPFQVDTTYQVDFERAGISEKMYLYQTDYSLAEESGLRTSLYFCRLGTIVAGVPTR